MRTVRLTLAAATLAVASGCYHYVPASPAGVSPGADVRAWLTDSGIDEMRGYFGPDVNSVEGPLVRWDGGGVALLVETYVSRPGFPPTSVADTIRLLPPHVATVELRELNRWRSAGLAAIIVGGAVAALLAARTVGGQSEEPELPPDPEAMILFRIPFRLPLRIPFGIPFF